MRTLLTLALFATLMAAAAERKSWSRVRYLGGTTEVKTSRYDWNTTITVTVDEITVTIDPIKAFAERSVIRLKPSEITGLAYGPGAWRRVSERVPAIAQRKPTRLFGVIVDYNAMAILYESGGKPGALLFESPDQWLILRTLETLSGKPVEGTP